MNVDEVMGAWRVFLIKDERIFLDGKRKGGRVAPNTLRTRYVAINTCAYLRIIFVFPLSDSSVCVRGWTRELYKRCSCHYVVINSTSFNGGVQMAIAGKSSTTYYYLACVVHAHIILQMNQVFHFTSFLYFGVFTFQNLNNHYSMSSYKGIS